MPTATAAHTLPTPESTVALPQYLQSFGREHPKSSLCQDVPPWLVALIHGQHLRDQLVSASTHFHARHPANCFPWCLMLDSPPAAMVEDVLRHLGHGLCTQSTSVVHSVAELS
jgi:hypothetical protein